MTIRSNLPLPKRGVRALVNLAAGLGVALAALAIPTGAAYALSSACQDVNAVWGGGRTATSGQDLWNDYVGFANGEELVYSASTSGSTPDQLAGTDPTDSGAGFALSQTITSPVYVKPSGGAEVSVSGSYRIDTSDNFIELEVWGGGGSGVPAPGQATATVSCRTVFPVTGAVSATLAGNSSANPITLNLSGPAATSVAVASAASHGTATASGTTISYTPTVGYSGPDSFTYTASNADGTSAAATVTITVNPVAPISGAVSATVAYGSSANPITLNLTGGTASSVAVASAAAHGTATASGTSVTYTPTAGYSGPDSFTYTATNATGTSAPATVTITVNPAAPVTGAVSATVALGSTANPITLNLTGGAPVSVAIASAAAHGTATASGTSITYTPTAGYSGPDSFTYTATNGTGTSAPATVTITVSPAAPITGAVSATVANGSSANPITLNLAGGAASSVAVATAAAHGTATASGTSVTYTPTAGYSGPDSFTYTATNATGTSAPATVTITVSPELPTAGAVTATVSAGSTNNAITLALSGGAATSIAIPSAPTNGYATVSGTTITYTPNAGYTGPDSFTYIATNVTGTSAPATVSIIVSPPPPMVFTPAAGALPQAMDEEAYEVAISATGSSTRVIYSLTAGALPQGLVLNITTGAITGTLAAGTAGNYAFTIKAADQNGGSVTAAYTLAVVAREITVTDKQIVIAPGATPLPIDLTSGATGGPFTAAVIGTVTPPQAGRAEVIMGEVAALQPINPLKFYLKFYPNPEYSGTALVGFTLTSALGVSNSGTVSFTTSITPEVVANRFDNLVRGFVDTRGSLLAGAVDHPGLRDRRTMASGARPGVLDIAPSGDSVTMNFASSLVELKAWGEAGDAAGTLAATEPTDQPFNVWIDGTATLHLRTDTGEDHWGSFSLLSLGADYLVNDKLLVGLAVHADFMDDLTDYSTIKGNGVLVGPYASVEIGDGVFFDAGLYYGKSWNDIGTSIFSGNFETERVLGKASLEGTWAINEALTLRPNVTAFYLRETTGNYTIADALGNQVTIAGFSTDQLRLTAGGKLVHDMAWGEDQVLSTFVSADLGLSLVNSETALLTTLGAGFDLTGSGPWTLGGTISSTLESNSLKSVAAKARLKVAF